MDIREISKNSNDFNENGCCLVENIISDDCRKLLVNLLALEELDEKWDELILFQGRGKPNLTTLQKGKDYLRTALAAYCESKGVHLDQTAGRLAFEAIFKAALEEEHMAVFKQI